MSAGARPSRSVANAGAAYGSGSSALAAEIARPVPLHLAPREKRVVGELLERRRGHAGVEAGIDQHLGAQRRASVVAGAQSHRGRQVGARAVAGDRDPGRIAPELPARGGEPARHGPAVLEAGGIRVLRRQAVVHRHDDRVGGPRQAAAHRVVRVEVPEHPSAAVEERNERLPPGRPPAVPSRRSPAVPPRRPRVAGPVHPHRDRPGRPGDRAAPRSCPSRSARPATRTAR